MTVSPEHFLRVSFAPESSWKVAGSYVHARGLKRGSTLTPGRETLPIDNALNVYGDRYAAQPGAQTFEAKLDYFVTANTWTDFQDVFQAALGVESTTASPTFSSSANNTSFVKSAGGFSFWHRLTGSNGSTYYCPNDSVATNTATLGVGLPAATAVTACASPGSSGGAEYHDGDGVTGVGSLGGGGNGAAPSFTMEFDWSQTAGGSAGQESILVSGCGLTGLSLVYSRDQALQISTSWIGASYDDAEDAAGNVADASSWTAFGPGWTGDWILSSSATPLWSDTKTAIKSLTCALGRPLIVERGMIGLDGGSTVASVLPGSDITGYTYEAHWQELLTIRVPWSAGYLSPFEAQAAHKLCGVLYPGVPGGAAISNTRRICLYWRRLVPVGRPVTVVDGGGRYMDLTFQVERATSGASGGVGRFALAFFNS
jgi:hypothetical protein